MGVAASSYPLPSPIWFRRPRLRRHTPEAGRTGLVLASVVLCAALIAESFALASGDTSAAVGAPAARPTAASILSIQPISSNRTCHLPAPESRMVTSAEFQNRTIEGWRTTADGDPIPCWRPGLLAPDPHVAIPRQQGRVVLVSRTQQWLWAYQDGKLVYAMPVTTGRQHLQTPLGVYHVYYKVTDVTFYSPWASSSPYYYAPEHINYALLFREGGYYLHDAPWRHAFGPGTNHPHTDPDGTHEDGSHGCVNMPESGAAWLYHWANIGTTVEIVA
jgi:hypothetical protein